MTARPGSRSRCANGGDGPDPLGTREGIAERAARVGITAERVLQEYARIAFADLRRIADWGSAGLTPRAAQELADDDAAAICELVPSGSQSGHWRVRLYDKKAALDALARHLGLFRREPQPQDSGSSETEEDPREVIARRLARLATGAAAE